MTILESNIHSAFMLRCHLVLAAKHRKKAIGNQVSASLKSIFERFAPHYTNDLHELGFESVHINTLFGARPKTETSKLGGAPPDLVRQHIESQGERQ
ncbi:MAG: transposase [Eubacteriaceae bacterium]|nr:transposase [Eubacteriaceae bacterium]